MLTVKNTFSAYTPDFVLEIIKDVQAMLLEWEFGVNPNDILASKISDLDKFFLCIYVGKTEEALGLLNGNPRYFLEATLTEESIVYKIRQAAMLRISLSRGVFLGGILAYIQGIIVALPSTVLSAGLGLAAYITYNSCYLISSEQTMDVSKFNALFFASAMGNWKVAERLLNLGAASNDTVNMCGFIDMAHHNDHRDFVVRAYQWIDTQNQLCLEELTEGRVTEIGSNEPQTVLSTLAASSERTLSGRQRPHRAILPVRTEVLNLSLIPNATPAIDAMAYIDTLFNSI